MRVESSLKGPMVPWTIEPFSSRMTALVGGTGKQFNQYLLVIISIGQNYIQVGLTQL